MPGEPEHREDHDRAAGDGQHRLAPQEPEPQLERGGREHERDENRAPAEHGKERVTPPMEERALIREQRDRGEHRERDDRDRADLVPDPRLERRARAAPLLPGGSLRHRYTCMITGSTIGRRFVRS